MVSSNYARAVGLLCVLIGAVNGASLTAPKGAKVLTVGVIGGKIYGILLSHLRC